MTNIGDLALKTSLAIIREPASVQVSIIQNSLEAVVRRCAMIASELQEDDGSAGEVWEAIGVHFGTFAASKGAVELEEHELYRLRGVVRSYTEALNHWRQAFDQTHLENRVREWVVSRIGPEHMTTRERAMRLLEEAIELAQAEGVTREQVDCQVAYTYSSKPGDPRQEASGVAICLYGWASAAGATLQEIGLAEMERIEARSAAEVQERLARKVKGTVITVVPE